MDFKVLHFVVSFQMNWTGGNGEQSRLQPVGNFSLSGIDYPYLAAQVSENGANREQCMGDRREDQVMGQAGHLSIGLRRQIGAGASFPVAVCADALKGGGLEEQRREKRPISVEAHGRSWLEHDLTTVKQSRLN
jgi:hypothetical protein